MATVNLMDQFSHLGEGGIKNNGALDAEVQFQPALRTMRTDFIQVKAGDSIVYKNMNGMASSWNILSFYTAEAQGSYVSGIAGQTTPQSGVWTAQQDGYVRLFGSFPAGDNISVTMTDLAPDVEDYLAKYNAMNYRFLPNSIPKIVAHIQEYLSNHPIADSTTLQAVIDAAFQSYMEEIQQTADTYIAEAVPPAAAAAVDAAASPALQEITAKAAEAAESARQAGLSQQSAEMSEENALTYRNQAQQIKDSITAEVAASVLAAQEQATLAQESAQAADESADTAEQYVAQARAQAEAAAAQAQTASGYASDAQGYMQDASGYAQNASDFADNAAQSAATFSTDPTLTISGKAADAKATGDQLSALKSATKLSEKEIFGDTDNTFPLEFENGTYYSITVGSTLEKYYGGGYDLSRKVVKSTVFNAPCNVILTAKSGYGFIVLTANDAVITATSGVVTSHTLEAGKQYGVILRTTDGTGDISALSVDQIIEIAYESRVDNIKNILDPINDALYPETIIINNTQEYTNAESDTSTQRFINLATFTEGNRYHIDLTLTEGDYTGINSVRVDLSRTSNNAVTALVQNIFTFNNPTLQTYSLDFTATANAVNMLARIKHGIGTYRWTLKVYEYANKSTIETLKETEQNHYETLLQTSRMQMGAHRGAESFAPPNSVVAYEIAGKMGFPWAWLAQIRWSASGTLYVMHDADVSITTNGTGNIQDLTDEYINSLLCNKITKYDYSQFSDDDLRVPTLEKAIQICLRYGMKMCFRIEPFPNQIETELHQTIWDNFERLVKEYRIPNDWCCFSGYNTAEMGRCITLFGEDADICPYLGAVTAQDVVDWFNSFTEIVIRNKSVLLNASNLTLADVKLLHTNGIKVYAFTNSTSPTQEQMEQFATWGVDIFQNPRYARIPIV